MLPCLSLEKAKVDIARTGVAEVLVDWLRLGLFDELVHFLLCLRLP